MHNLNIGAYTDLAHVSAGGALIDSVGQKISILTGLTEDSASPGGGLTKLGNDTLLLDGINSYTGPMVCCPNKSGTSVRNCREVESPDLNKKPANIELNQHWRAV